MAKKRRTGTRPHIEDDNLDFKGIEMNKPVTNLLGFTIFIYGNPKIGKTTSAVSWPDSIVLACEVKGVKALKVPNIKCRSWDHVLKAVKELKKKENRKKYSSVVIDTTDLLYKYCFSHCCEKYGFDHPSDQGWGKGWERISDEFLAIILEIFDLGYTLIFTSHTKITQIKEDWEEYAKIEPTLAGPARKVLLPLVDVIFYMMAKDDKDKGSTRVITTKATRAFEAGDRTRCLTDVTIKIPEKMKDKAYMVINKVYNQNLKKGL